MKKALLVGINQYQLPGNNLSGCVNDVIALRNLLISVYGYKLDDIQILTDANATKVNIVNYLRWLLTNKAEHLTFHYSGHGTEFFNPATNKNGQAICPCDAKDLNSLITDTELANILGGIPTGAKLAFIADCCHSGSIDRELHLGNPYPAKARVMFIPGLARPQFAVPRTMMSVGDHLLLSGCREDQTSADAYFQNAPHGAMSYAMLLGIQQNPKQSWASLHDGIVSWLARNGLTQVPQLSGPPEFLNLPLFT